MENEHSISIKEAKHQFSTILNNLKKSDKMEFVNFALNELASEDDSDLDGSETLDDPATLLNNISHTLRSMISANAMPDSIAIPIKKENTSGISNTIEDIDKFLYDNEEIQELVNEGKLNKYYCKDCGSKNMESIPFKSDSISREDLFYIFNTCLPTLEDKTVLDINSRLGSFLYGTYAYTDASRIIGIETNETFYKLQNDILKKYNMTDRIEVLQKKLNEIGEIINTADVVFINNAFEFCTEDEQISNWQYLKQQIKSEVILITRPNLESIFGKLKTNITSNDWVKPYELEDFDLKFDDDIGFYKVL